MKNGWRLEFLMIFFLSVWDQRCSTGAANAGEDKCLTKPCGPNAVCHNTSGSFHCTCGKGYYSTEDHQFAGAAMASCNDYDECHTIRDVCGNNASCHNTMGGFYCLCHKGFARVSGETNFTGYSAGCRDIDECHTIRDVCGNNASCHNTMGGFYCLCHKGFARVSGETNFTGYGAGCRDSFLTCLATYLRDESTVDKCYSRNRKGSQQPTADHFCSLFEPTLTLAERICESERTGRAGESPTTLENVMNLGNKFVNDSLKMEQVDNEKRLQSTSLFLDAMESFALDAALASPSHKIQNLITPHLDLDVRVIQASELRDLENIPDRITLHAQENSMDAYLKTMTQGNAGDSVAIAFISYNELNSLQSADFIEKERSRPYKLISGVVSATIRNRKHHKLSERVNITLKHKKDSRVDGQPVCVYWNHTKGKGYWSPEGCAVINSNKTHTACGCQHLSSFAILMTAVEEDHRNENLNIITQVGISLSLVCLGLCIITFQLCNQVPKPNSTIHTNLCITLFLAELLFLVGINSIKHKVVCGIIAGCLHYLFLAAFAWMCVEGIHLHLMVRNLQKISNSCARKVLRWFMYPFGYGMPAVIVIISAATYSTGYGTHHFCWLTIENGFIWSFIGPLCTIILFNTALFAVTLWMLKAQLVHLNAEVTKIKDMRILMFKAVAQVVVLGCPWIFGVFQFWHSEKVMAYLFTIVNSFQGIFIFIILCLLNQQVRDGYRAFFNRLRMIRKKAGFTNSETASVPMTSATVSRPLVQCDETV
ncbi:adhesion G protein-coupled receptor E2-like [Carcharodon carcharias]|uniref:adhesion G protein-coupled receptor E2-like n=1 Tax=Carcharodon carcharias TaxID=13397 RepID=UPI001B7E1999|nr:adhesion G protein-coupled receptor E2-like [Carcharodon carcharias]